MKPIYAVCITASQGIDRPTVSALLRYTDEELSKTVELSWDIPHGINAPDQPGEWLLALLSRVVQDYDDHHIHRVVFEPNSIFEGEAHVEA